ncbi:MAG: hypothetical protein WCF85_01180 [Rhodospirillaceae bacterium]
MKGFARTILSMLLLLLLSLGSARADGWGQLSFNEATDSAGGVALHYVFSERLRAKSYEIGFVLPSSSLRFKELGTGIGIGRYDQNALVHRVQLEVGRAIQPYGGAVVAEVRAASGGYAMNLRARGISAPERVLTGIQQVAVRAVEAYLSDNYLTHLREHVVIPDYGRLAGHYIAAMQPVAEALNRLAPDAGKRDKLTLALTFMQSIPYDDFTLRRRESGYVVPPDMLVRNKGDCGTKSVALASLLATLIPDLPVVIILIPEHALMGVGMMAGLSEHSLTRDGRSYLLVEPVGPAQLPPGQISSQTRKALANGQDITILPVRRP